jgi:SAM-dependent methyltransferase
MALPDTAARVRAQYEALPYPPRDPADEARRLVSTVGDDLAELSHYAFRGQRPWTRGGFRCLVAGGGTGDAAIFLAEQLRGTGAEVVYLDMTEASRRVAEARAQARGLANIRWVTASLLDIPSLGLGPFHYINCSGVLHHLPEPKDGLRSLATALADDGAMFLMLYARYGRRGVYDMQAMLRALVPESLPIPERVRLARSLLAQLPASNHFQRSRDSWAGEIEAGGYGDAGLYDLLLHSQDRAYDVDAIYELLDAAGLALVDFTGRQKRSYDPRAFIKDAELAARCDALDRRARFALAERLAGDIIKHSFYAARSADRSARLDDDRLAVVLAAELKGLHEPMHHAIVPGQPLAFTYTLGATQETFEIPGNAITQQLFRHFDGRTPIATIVDAVRKSARADAPAVRAELARVFALLHPMGWAYLNEP